jgi:hypothetical protein
MEAIMPSSVARLVIEEVIASEWRLLAGLIGKAASVEQFPGNAPQILVNPVSHTVARLSERQQPRKMLLGN